LHHFQDIAFDDIEYELTKLNSALLAACHKACPERRVSGRKKVPWWNHELSILRKAANKAFHKACKSKLEQDWQAHRAARRSFKKELRRSKRESWQDFCAKTEGASDTSRGYKLLAKSNTAPLGMLKLPTLCRLSFNYMGHIYTPNFWLMSIVAKRSPISVTAEHLLYNLCPGLTNSTSNPCILKQSL